MRGREDPAAVCATQTFPVAIAKAATSTKELRGEDCLCMKA